MKYLFTATLIIILTTITFGQSKTLPSVEIKTIDGKTIDVSKITNNGNPTVISFWATWCKPCKTELNAIAKVYESWQKETGVNLIAVSIDNSRSASRVQPYVKGQGWKYEILLDPNGDFKKAMNVNNIPHTFLIDGKGNIVWDHNKYIEGDEKELYKQIKKHSKK